MTRMWVAEGTEDAWEAFGWKELGRQLFVGVPMVFLEHEETVDAERALYGDRECSAE